MKNFEYYNPVRVLFGQGTIPQIDHHIPADARVLLCYGGGSIFKNGVYDQVMQGLGDRTVVEFGGIMPNPEYEYLVPVLDVIQKEKVDFLLAVGGGSIVDAVKFIAAASLYEGADPWDILAQSAPVRSALPFGAVLTLPATGSEMNGNSVITKAATKEKLAFGSPAVFPVFSVLDPETTYSLPLHQVANGVIDAFVHVMEQYLTYPVHALVQDAFAESLLLILKKEGPRAVCGGEPDYPNRANLMWAATNALNTQLSMGVITDWSTHGIGHELTALHGLDHAVTLAIVLPGVMKVMADVRTEKLMEYAERIWGLTGFDHQAVVGEAINRTENFFEALGVKTHLSDYGIGEDTIDLIDKRLRERGLTYLGRSKDVHVDHVREILHSRL